MQSLGFVAYSHILSESKILLSHLGHIHACTRCITACVYVSNSNMKQYKYVCCTFVYKLVRMYVCMCGKEIDKEAKEERRIKAFSASLIISCIWSFKPFLTIQVSLKPCDYCMWCTHISFMQGRGKVLTRYMLEIESFDEASKS